MQKQSLSIMKNKDIYFRLASLVCLAIIPLYPNVAYALTNCTGLSYMLTGLIFSFPIIALMVLVRHKWLYCALTSLLTILALTDLTMVDLYKDFLLPGGIISTIKTNPQEASEFYHTNLREVFHWIPLIFICLAACILYKPSSNRKISAYISFTLLLIAPLFVSYKLFGFYKSQITLRYYVNNRIWNRPPYNVPFQCLNAHKSLQRKKQWENMKNISMEASRTIVPERQKEIYIFAIGESLRYDNVSLNKKYRRSTTPQLESKEDNIMIFDNYYSQACLTMYSVPQLVTRATPDNYELNYAERSIIEPYRECGFKVFTIVSSTNLLSYETYLSDGVDSLIIVPNVVENGEIISGDKTMIHIVDSLANEHDKLFIMMQFMGNHSFFTNYEKEYERYNPNSNNCSDDLVRDSTMLINAYDNSILYTDYILSAIIDQINRPNTVSAFMFVSDHGEDIANGGAGHGGNCTPKIEEYHVPFIFWWSDSYQCVYANKVSYAKSRKQAKLNGDNIYYTLCDLADIQVAEHYNKPSWSVLSPAFEEHERLILVPDGVTCIHPDN